MHTVLNVLWRSIQRLQQELPCAILRQVGQCGHIPHVEKPREAAKHVLDFLGSDNTENVDQTSFVSSDLVSTLKYVCHCAVKPLLFSILSCWFNKHLCFSIFVSSTRVGVIDVLCVLSNVLQDPVKRTRPFGLRVRGNMYMAHYYFRSPAISLNLLKPCNKPSWHLSPATSCILHQLGSAAELMNVLAPRSLPWRWKILH
jgi:hypothetical protein